MHMLYAHTHVCSRATQRCRLSWVPLRYTFHALPFQNPGAGLPSCSGGQGSLLCWKWSVGGQEGGDKGRSQWEFPPPPSEPSFFACLIPRDPEIRSPAKERVRYCLEIGQRGKVPKWECEKPPQARGEELPDPRQVGAGHLGSTGVECLGPRVLSFHAYLKES